MRDKADNLTGFIDRGTGAENRNYNAVAIAKASVIGTQNDSPGHDALGLALMTAVVFGI